jgi:hypothetical protein
MPMQSVSTCIVSLSAQPTCFLKLNRRLADNALVTTQPAIPSLLGWGPTDEPLGSFFDMTTIT